MVARKRLNITLYVHCSLSCYNADTVCSLRGRSKSLYMLRVTVVFKSLTSILVLSPCTPDPWHCFSSRVLGIFTIKRNCYRSLRSRVSERSVFPL